MDNTYTADAVSIANFMSNMASKNISIGHLISLKVGGDELKQDFRYPDPMAPAEKVKMCGMLTYFHWNGEPGGVITIEGRVPSTCKGMLQGAIATKNKSAECEFEINFYAPEGEKTYYKCFHTNNTKIKAKILKDQCTVDNNKATDYTHIPNHHFRLVIDPSDQADQELHLDYGGKIINVLPYGGQVAAG